MNILRSHLCLFNQRLQVLLSLRLFRGLFYFLVVNHPIGEMDDLKVSDWSIDLVKILNDVGHGACAMPLSRVLVIQETHPGHILNTKCAFLSVCVIVH